MKFLVAFLSTQFFFGNANASVRLGDWLLDELGYPIAWPYGAKDPVTLCNALGAHLPTPRELAEWASRPCTESRKLECGAKGIRETQFRNVDELDPRVQAEALRMEREGFVGVAYGTGEEPRIRYIDFYFNGDGFIPAPRERYTPETILSSGWDYPGGHIQFVPAPEEDYDHYFVYNWLEGGHRKREGGIRCAFAE